LNFAAVVATTAHMKSTFVCLIALCSLALSLEAAPPSSGAAKPGRYTDFHDVDEVTIVQPFQLANYKTVVVAPVDTRNAPLPPEKDNSYADVKTALATSTELFVQGMQQKAGGLQVRSGQSGGADALLVRTRITKSDPGSQAARYWGGFGAGAVKVGMTGEIIDGRSNKVLVRFTQERRSGFGMFGGGYRDLLHRTMKQIGGDVANLLKAF
jgi:hypothetical protein